MISAIPNWIKYLSLPNWLRYLSLPNWTDKFSLPELDLSEIYANISKKLKMIKDVVELWWKDFQMNKSEGNNYYDDINSKQRKSLKKRKRQR